MNPEKSIFSRPISRRTALRAGTGLIVAAAVGCGTQEPNKKTTISPHEKERFSIQPQPFFESWQANEVAEEKGITAGDLLLFRPEVLDTLSAFSQEEEILPIYPPAVMQYKDVIYDASDRFSIPPNVVATIMAIESAGVEDAESWVGAQGLFQVMPFHFPEETQENPSDMRIPADNAFYGMQFFASCLETARNTYPDLNPDGALIYARAMMAYNAGQGSISQDFSELPDETKYYGDHFIRYAITAEIAGGLRENGYANLDIKHFLNSKDISARAYALQEFGKRNPGYSYEDYTNALRYLAMPIPGYNAETKTVTDGGKLIYEDYVKIINDQRENEPAFYYTPALTIWNVGLGGYPLYAQSPVNLSHSSHEFFEDTQR